MAAVVVVPHRHPHLPARPAVPTRPPLQVIPGGRRAARAYALGSRSTGRLHPAVYRRRRLGVALAVVTIVLIGYLAVLGAGAALQGGLADPAPPPGAASAAAASGPADLYTVLPGDTLWTIARRLQPSGDVRDLVDRLADRAGASPLQAGQALRIDGLVS